MKKNQKNAFTLVELLAVIVILAIILVIAVPKIMNVIKDTTKASLESSAKMVAAQVENQYTVAQTLGKEFGDTGSCMQDWAGLNDVDYASCTYEVTTDGTAKVTIKGQGKFNGLYVCNGTKTNSIAIDTKCPVPIVEYFEDLYNDESLRNANGLVLDDTDDENIRFAGSDIEVKNYVEFGNKDELWRIIGLFEVETANGEKEKLIKIVRNESIGGYSYDSSANNVNTGLGVNEWSQADLMTELKEYYLNQESGYCCASGKLEVCNESSGAVVCDFSETTIDVKGINSTYRSMVESVVWNLGAVGYGEYYMPASQVYEFERVIEIGENGEGTGKICASSSWCNDTVTRTLEWTGKIGLIYLSDYLYASTDENCRIDIFNGIDWDNSDFSNVSCGKNNWLHVSNDSYIYWTITPMIDSTYARRLWLINPYGMNMAFPDAGLNYEVRPSLYLKSDVLISGEGSISNPYKLSA